MNAAKQHGSAASACFFNKRNISSKTSCMQVKSDVAHPLYGLNWFQLTTFMCWDFFLTLSNNGAI